jgi:exopolysaccharide production protein ExoQ
MYAFVLIDLYDLRFDVFLNDLGKDATLTGRTTLWTLAVEYIEKNFWLGVGYYGFWVQGHGEAEYIWELLHIDGRSGFHFHNAYIHFAVDLGVVGATLVALQFFLALYYSIKLAISSPDSNTAFLLSVTFFFFMRSFVEVDFGYPFSFSTVVITSTFLYTLKIGRRSVATKRKTYMGHVFSGRGHAKS